MEDLLRIADSSRGRIQIKFQRNEAAGEATISRKAIRKSGEEGVARLGITTSPGRSFRITGFYSHYETYAEVLQLIAALAVGMFIAYPNKKSLPALFLGASIPLITATLILTSTRAALVGLSIAVAVMAFASFSRRILVLALLAIVLIAPLAYIAVKHTRGSNIFNPQEDSTQYRVEVWREAMSLIKDHPIAGIGKGSEGSTRLREKYELYNGGKLPPGHFHSTPIQIATWWGLPALGFYVALMVMFFLKMWRSSQLFRAKKDGNAWGIVLGGMGALVAFNVSSLAHFNFGDGEVVMMFWLLTGLVFAVRQLATDEIFAEQANNKFVPPAIEDSRKNQLLELEALAESNVRVAAVTQNSKSQ
jgi:O-antigen ligase